MKLTLRARLTLWYMLGFVLLIAFLGAAFAFTLRHQLNRDLKKALKTEEKWLAALFEDEFAAITDATGDMYETVVNELREELDERYAMKRQFGILLLHTRKGDALFSSGVKNVEFFLPPGFLDTSTSGQDVFVGKYRYRVRVAKRPWGTLAVGLENQTFFRVFEEFGEIFLLLIPVSLLLIAAGGWLLAKLAMRPVAAAARTAESISMRNLNERLPVYQGEDEFGSLVVTLNSMIARIEGEVRRLQQFTEDAAHELRTPLTVLRGELELAYQELQLPDAARDVIQNALDRVIVLSEIVENLMLLARADHRSAILQPAQFSLDELVREIFEDCQILAEKQPVEVALPRCDRVEICGDRHLIRRLIFNLCDNALKYTTAGKIVLELHRNAPHAAFTVTDTGEGIAAENLPHIFDRFYRVTTARTSTAGGSGLGLAICKWIAEAHKGQIFVESELGRGTRVEVCLPLNYLSRSSESAPGSESEVVQRRNGGGKEKL